MSRALILAAIIAAIAFPANAKPPGFMEGLNWAQKPAGQDLAPHFPRKAAREDVAGHAVVICRIQEGGGVGDCVVAGEGPEGYGFGKASLDATQYFRLTTTTPEGTSTEGAPVAIPMTWALPGYGLPPKNYVPGEPVLLAEPAPPSDPWAIVRTLPCPAADAPARMCPTFYWKSQPSMYDDLKPIIRQGSGVSLMECLIDDQGLLSQCIVDGGLPANAAAELVVKAAAYEAPAETFDGTPTTGQQVRLRYDWKALQHYMNVHYAVAEQK